MAANYNGPTRIYYNLPGRTHTYLPIPIYKCEGSGKAVLTIEVNPKGIVITAKIIASESTTSDPCLIETAINSALISQIQSRHKCTEGSDRYSYLSFCCSINYFSYLMPDLRTKCLQYSSYMA